MTLSFPVGRSARCTFGACVSGRAEEAVTHRPMEVREHPEHRPLQLPQRTEAPVPRDNTRQKGDSVAILAGCILLAGVVVLGALLQHPLLGGVAGVVAVVAVALLVCCTPWARGSGG